MLLVICDFTPSRFRQIKTAKLQNFNRSGANALTDKLECYFCGGCFNEPGP